jgi:diguanylate cyclase (GGDEF)-like protein
MPIPQHSSLLGAQPKEMAVRDSPFNMVGISGNYGHHAGELVLKGATQSMSKALREIGVFGRWRGEEFMCTLPHTRCEDAIRCAERLCQSLDSANFGESSLALRATTSYGQASSQDSDGEQDIFSRCDQALYLAKSQGCDPLVPHLESSDAA